MPDVTKDPLRFGARAHRPTPAGPPAWAPWFVRRTPRRRRTSWWACRPSSGGSPAVSRTGRAPRRGEGRPRRAPGVPARRRRAWPWPAKLGRLTRRFGVSWPTRPRASAPVASRPRRWGNRRRPNA